VPRTVESLRPSGQGPSGRPWQRGIAVESI